MATAVWGLDIGNSAIKAIKMVRTESDECKIADFDIIDMPEASEEEKETPLPRIEAAMKTLVANHKFGADPVYIAVAGGMCLQREFQLPPGSESKLDDLVLYEVKQQIPFPIDQVEWGFERYEDPNGIGISMFAVRKTDIQGWIDMLKRLGLRVAGIVPASMSLFNFIKYEFAPQSTTLILDAGARSTDFIVMNKRQIFSRPIQIAGREITRVLENKFKVSFEKAEELKKNISQSPQAQKILGVIEPTLRQLGAEIQKTVGFYKSRAKGQRLNQAYLLGHTFRLPGMAETLQGLVREAPFALVEGLQKIKLDYTVNADVWNNEFPTMAVAIGLGLQGLGVSELKLNLLPAGMKVDQAMAGMKVWASFAAALVLITVGFTYVNATGNLDRYNKVLESAAGVDQDSKKYDTEEKKVTEAIPKNEDVLKRLSRVARDRGKVLDAFNTLVNLQKDGKPCFGQESDARTLLTGVYISRDPLKTLATTQGGDDPRSPLATTGEGKEALTGKASVYSYLAKGSDPLALAPELRPEPPLLVVVSGEYDGSGNKGAQPLTALKSAVAALQIPGANEQTIRPVFKENFAKRTELPLIYAHHKAEGEHPVKTGQALPEISYTNFNLVMRFDDKIDPDNEPKEASAPAAGAPGAPGAKGPAPKK